MTTKEIIDWFSERTGKSLVDSRLIILDLLAFLKKELIDGNDVKLHGIGIIKKCIKGPRTVRNPKTNERIDKPSKVFLKMNFSKKFLEELNDNRGNRNHRN